MYSCAHVYRLCKLDTACDLATRPSYVFLVILTYFSGTPFSPYLLSYDTLSYASCKIKLSKSDGNIGLTTDYLKHGSHKLCVYLSMLFSTMLSHS